MDNPYKLFKLKFGIYGFVWVTAGNTEEANRYAHYRTEGEGVWFEEALEVPPTFWTDAGLREPVWTETSIIENMNFKSAARERFSAAFAGYLYANTEEEILRMFTPMKLYSILSAEAVKGMNGNRGRMSTQAAHGFIHALWDAGRYFPEDVETYRNQPSAFKVTLVAPDADTLRALQEKYKGKCGTSLVEETGSKSDGTTNEVVKAVTALGIGPLRVTDACDDLKALKNFL